MKSKTTFFIVIFLVVVSFASFSPVLDNDFINLDDPGYITENPHVQSGISLEGIQWAFTAVNVAYWHPLTFISHMTDWSLFGADAAGHHLVSLLLHICCVLILFLFLQKTTGRLWPSAFVAAVFALHPLRVESVAWAAERKDVLSMFFGLASIYVYSRYVQRNRLSRYFGSLVLFALSLMSKPMLVTLPFALLLLDYWPLNRLEKVTAGGRSRFIGRLLLEKVPFILLTAAASTMTFWAQSKVGAVTESIRFSLRAVNAVISGAAYLGKIFWPVNLAVLYPYQYAFPLWQVVLSVCLLIVLTCLAVYCVRKLPYLFVGWFWYLGTLIPVIGLVQVGPQAMADRFTYLPSIGIAIVLAWGLPHLFRYAQLNQKILAVAGIAVVLFMAALTWHQTHYWKNSIVMWNHTLSVTQNNYVAHKNLGLALAGEGEFEKAIEQYNATIRIAPGYGIDYHDRGVAYARLGQHARAVEDYNYAIRLESGTCNYYYDRGLSYNALGQYQPAVEDFSQAVRLCPGYPQALNNRGIAYSRLGQYQRALEDFTKAIGLIPQYVKAYSNRSEAYFRLNRIDSGCSDARSACALGYCETLNAAKSKGICR